MKQWISVKDSLPGVGYAVLIYDVKCGVAAARMSRHLKRVWDQATQSPKMEPDTSQPPYWTDLEGEDPDNYYEVTHWMDYPDPPEVSI